MINNKILKKTIGFFVLLFCIYLFIYLNYKDTTFILVYHRIDNYRGGLKSLYVKPTSFDKQMRFLYLRGYKTISLEELKYRIKKGLSVKKMFCITFDDGYEDLVNAYKILKKYNFKAIVYLHTEAIQDGSYTYPGMISAKMISLEQLKGLTDIFEFGSHTVSHPDLTQIDEKEIVKEIANSKKFIENNLNVKVKHFCYPFGKIPNNYKEIISSENYDTAVSLNPGLVYVKDRRLDFYLLPRVEWKEVLNMNLKDFLRNLDFYIKIFFGI